MKKALSGFYDGVCRLHMGIHGMGSDEDVIRGMTVLFFSSLAFFIFGGFVLGEFSSSAYAVVDLNSVGSSMQSEASSVTKGIYYGAGGLGVVTAAGGLMHIKTAHKQGHPIAPGVTAVAMGSGMAAIGTYMGVINQSSVSSTGGMSTNSMGVPQ